MGKTDDGHCDFANGSGGVRYRPDRDRDCRWRHAVGRRTDGVRTTRLHDRPGGVVLVFAAPLLASAFGVNAAVV
ncbi:MAG TPA: hypothetical protein VHY84_15840 [Bryobacteraceae bacterium]|nr:hypothetical protein [Bryobacteraceae bacterium]